MVAVRALGADDRLRAGPRGGDGLFLAGSRDGLAGIHRKPPVPDRICPGGRGRGSGIVSPGGAEPEAAAPGYRRAHGTGDPGAMALGQWDEAATVAFLYGLFEALEGRAWTEPGGRSGRCWTWPPRRPSGSGQMARFRWCRPARSRRRPALGPRRRHDPGRWRGGLGSFERRSEDDHRRVGPGGAWAGDPVYAGTVNGEGTLEVRASGPVGDALISRVVDQVRANQAGRAPIERRISRFAAVYTPIVVGLSLTVMLLPPLIALIQGGPGSWDAALWREWFSRGLVVLVIACPRALVIATPVAVVSGLAAAARSGILIRGGEYLEEIGARALAFDNTGTLTQGRPDVVEVVCAPGHEDEERVVRIAAALGDRGGHVVGKAIARYARGRSLDVPIANDYRAVPGLGARAAPRRRVSPGQPSLHR